MSAWPEGIPGGTEQEALAWDSGYWGRFTLATLAKPSAHAFPYSNPAPQSRYCVSMTPPTMAASLPTTAQRLSSLTRPNEESFPYTLKPRGWTRSSDPFTVAARERLAERVT